MEKSSREAVLVCGAFFFRDLNNNIGEECGATKPKKSGRENDKRCTHNVYFPLEAHIYTHFPIARCLSTAALEWVKVYER